MTMYKKNLLVGITVLAALALLGVMILLFGDVPARLFAPAQMSIELIAQRADGITEGSPIQYLGVNVGRIHEVRRSPDQTMVIMEARVDEDPPLPANIEGVIHTQLLGGGSAVDLRLIHAQPISTTQPILPPQPQGALQPGQQITVRYAGVDLLPPEFNELAQELRRTTRQVRESDLIPNLNQTVLSFREQAEKAGQVLESIQSIVADEQIRQDLRSTAANLRQTTESASRVAANLEKLSQNADVQLNQLASSGNRLLTTTEARVDQAADQLNERMQQLATVLGNFESASRKLNEGQGTAAMLLNDPKLYESLLGSSRELQLMLADFRRLVEQWEQEGIYFKISK